jgi:hypothetical protein
VLRGSYDVHPGLASGVFVSGSRAYVTGDWFRIIDVSDPSSPTLLGSYYMEGKVCYDVVVSGGLAYVAGDYLYIFDVSNPSSPKVRSSYEMPPCPPYRLWISGNLAYVADDWGGLQIIDVSNPSAPAFRGSFDTMGDAEGVWVSGNLIYVCGASGLWILRYTGTGIPPAAPSNPAAATLSPFQIQLSWSDNSKNEQGYRIERRMGASWKWTRIASFPANRTSYLDGSVSPDTAYSYRVCSYGPGGESAWCDLVTSQTPRRLTAAQPSWSLYE